MNHKVLYIGAIAAAASLGGLALYAAVPNGAAAKRSGASATDTGSGETRSANGMGTGSNVLQGGGSEASRAAAAQAKSKTESKGGVLGWLNRVVGGDDDSAANHVDGASGGVVSGQDTRPPGFLERLFGGGSSSSGGQGAPQSPGGLGSKNAGAADKSGVTGRPGSQDSKGSKGAAAIGDPGAIGPAGAAGGRAPGTTLCAGGPSKNAERCLKCEDANCRHDPKYRPFCEDFSDPKDQARCQSVLDCIRTSNCVATGSVSCYCGPDLNVVTCKSNPPSPGVATGAHGDCVAEIIAGFPPDSSSKFVIDHFADMKTPSGVALSLGQCDYANCGDITSSNDCVPYCPE